MVSQGWSYRWNFQLMAAQGYVVVAPNRRGCPSFGSEWREQISGDYAGQNIQDYLAAIDEVAKEPWCDTDHLGCIGASYGGLSCFSGYPLTALFCVGIMKVDKLMFSGVLRLRKNERIPGRGRRPRRPATNEFAVAKLGKCVYIKEL